MSRTTLRDIAREAKVSHVTVSHVLRGNDVCAPKTRANIMAVAKQLGYRPNVAARAMTNGKFNTIGLVLSASDRARSTLPEDMLRGASESVEAQGMHLSVTCVSDERLADAKFVPAMLREWTCDGLLLNYNKAIPPRMIELIEYYQIPSIWLNRKSNHDSVYPDDLAAGRTAVQHLVELGHRRIAYLGHPDMGAYAHYSEIDRLAGYRQGMVDAGLASGIREFEQADVRTWIGRLGSDRPTAIVAYGHDLLFSVLQAIATVGLHTPDDISLMTFGETPAFAGVELATMLVPNHAVGKRGVQMLQRKIEQPHLSLPALALPFDFTAQATLGSPVVGG